MADKRDASNIQKFKRVSKGEEEGGSDPSLLVANLCAALAYFMRSRAAGYLALALAMVAWTQAGRNFSYQQFIMALMFASMSIFQTIMVEMNAGSDSASGSATTAPGAQPAGAS